MGTNYYFRMKPCPYCNRAVEDIHLGKDSYGWKFTFEVHIDLGINSFDSLKQFIHTHQHEGEIVDDHNRLLSWEEFCEIVNGSMRLNGVDSVKEDSEYSYYDSHGYVWYNREFS